MLCAFLSAVRQSKRRHELHVLTFWAVCAIQESSIQRAFYEIESFIFFLKWNLSSVKSAVATLQSMLEVILTILTNVNQNVFLKPI